MGAGYNSSDLPWSSRDAEVAIPREKNPFTAPEVLFKEEKGQKGPPPLLGIHLNLPLQEPFPGCSSLSAREGFSLKSPVRAEINPRHKAEPKPGFLPSFPLFSCTSSPPRTGPWRCPREVFGWQLQSWAPPATGRLFLFSQQLFEGK